MTQNLHAIKGNFAILYVIFKESKKSFEYFENTFKYT